MATIASDRIQHLQARICRSDDQRAYKELFTTLYPALFRFSLEIVKSRQSAEEIISDVFMKIWERRKSLEEIVNLPVYCFVAAKNRSINELEKQKRQATCNIEEAGRYASNPSVNPEQMMISEEMLQRIYAVVESLPSRCKLAFKLVKENGFSYRETAEILHVSVKTVENQLAIALKKISAAIHFDICRSIPLLTGS